MTATSKKNIFAWINGKGHFQGIFWTICACFFSNLGDTSVKLVGDSLPAIQITFFRAFLGTLLVLPILLYKGKSSFTINSISGHFLRVIIGFGALASWTYGASKTSLPSTTTISFACPILLLPLAYFFLGEKSDWRRIASVIAGFIGVLIIAFFEGGHVEQLTTNLYLHQGIIFLFFGALLFAMSDIINKKMLASEKLLALLFYFYLGTTLVSLIPALLYWHHVTYQNLLHLLLLALSGTSILYCVLKAADATEISSIAPYKYFELIISIIMGYMLFNEVIKIHTIAGASLIIPSALLIAYYEINNEKKKLARVNS